jgi:hypothetical protein
MEREGKRILITGGAEAQAFVAQFKRVMLIDSVAHPVFRPERLPLYLQEREAVTRGGYRRVVYVPQSAVGEQE